MRPLGNALPRRVAAYYLAFSLFAVACFAVGQLLVARGIQAAGADGEGLAMLGEATQRLAAVPAARGRTGLQREVERLRQDHGLVACALIGPDGRFVVHTNRPQRGQAAPNPAGDRARWDAWERVRMHSEAGLPVRAFRGPVQRGGESLGVVWLEMAEPSLSTVLINSLVQAPWALAGSLLCVVAGAVVMVRQIRPLADVDGQLRGLARATTSSEFPLQAVPVRGGAALGWNRLVQESQNRGTQQSLDARLEQAVATGQDQHRDDILQSLSDGVAVTGEDGRIHTANRSLAALLGHGVDHQSLSGKTVLELLDGFGPLDEESQPGRQFRSDRAFVAEVERGEAKDLCVLRIARNPIRDDDGRRHGSVWTVRDITQQRLAEQMRDQFLDSATHELRTPLANIKAYAETLALSEMTDIEQQKQFCNTINAEATRLARFIDDLLSVSSMEVGSLSVARQEVDIERWLNEVLDKVRPQMDQKSIAFNANLPAKLPKLHIDKDKMAAALVNLLGNAAKYTPDSGTVTLRVRAEDAQLVIEVEDNGMGISEEDLPRLFDKFFRSDDVRVQEETGTGLGLSFTQEVVRLHDGQLDVKSKLNEGSTFTVTLPIR